MGCPSRRQFLASTASAGMLGAVPSLLVSGRPALAMLTTTIRVGTRVIEVNGRPATVFGLTQADGSYGLITEVGKSFRVRLENQLDEEILIHWHGLTPSRRQDGVPNLSQAPLSGQAATSMPGMTGGQGILFGTPPGTSDEMTEDRVRALLERQPSDLGNPRLKFGEIGTASDGSITAEIVTVDGSLVQKLAFNRYPGLVRQIVE